MNLKLSKLQKKFIFEGLLTLILSVISLVVFYKTGKFILHPMLYIITLIMGIGWTLTALWSIKEIK